MCLRFDVLKNMTLHSLAYLAEKETKGAGQVNSFIRYVVDNANKASKDYFIASLIGYFIAIITTVVIMFIFDHG